MFKTIKLILITLTMLIPQVVFAAPIGIELDYFGSGVLSFQEPMDIASYQVYYASDLNLDGPIYLKDLSRCPEDVGLFCIAKNISRVSNTVYLNLKDSMKDATLAIRYKDINGDLSPVSNLINIKNIVSNVDIFAFSDSKNIYFEIDNTASLNLNEYSFQIFYKKTGNSLDPNTFNGCRNYVQLNQIKCVGKRIDKIGSDTFRVEIKDQFLEGYQFVVAYKDSHSDQLAYSKPVYINNSFVERANKLEKIENLKVNDNREIFFSPNQLAVKYYVSYSKEYPGYTPELSDLSECSMQEVSSGCAIDRSFNSNSRIYLSVRDDLDSGFFVVYYEDTLGRLSALSRPVYVQKKQEKISEELKIPTRLYQISLDEIAFEKMANVKKYYLVHTYGDKVGFLYHSDFPGCKYSGLNCAGYNIREIMNRYYIKLRPEKTGNRFAVYYEDFQGNISALSNSIYIPRSPILNKSKLTDINFTEYFEAISDLHSKSIIDGYSDNTFRPFKKITRAEFLKIAMEAYFPEIGLYNPNYSCFSDVNVSDWYNKYICFAKQNGVIDGYLDGTFQPNKNISLAEALKVSLYSSGFIKETNDNYTQEPWYQPLMNVAKNNGLLPLSILNVNPDYLINRGEMAYITYKILNN